MLLPAWEDVHRLDSTVLASRVFWTIDDVRLLLLFFVNPI